ncbi:MAG: response regulator [Deltaproteobacteria bacterium]|nr:response regulator [Deltaproteobacteria bacterium]
MAAKKRPHLIEEAEILVVDDVPENLQTVMNILRNEGCHVRGAVNGELALQAASQCLPDLILLDIRMPVMDGFEVYRRLKGDKKKFR